jgi:inhibitor of cysteine peptidase
MQLTDEDSGRAVTITVSEELEVTLEANPTTGYRWEVSAADPKVLAPRPSRFVPGSKGIGSGGREILSFRGIEAGHTDLKLSLQRPFERGKPPAKEFRLTVTVIEG